MVTLKKYLSYEQWADFFAELYALRLANMSEADAIKLMANNEDNRLLRKVFTSLSIAPNLISD